jgi:DNA-binding CsgD family transcriptional regulator
VGRSLGITERTVETHVAHIMGKLAIGSRAEIAAWATRQGLAGGP